jgi:hypothetical protein
MRNPNIYRYFQTISLVILLGLPLSSCGNKTPEANANNSNTETTSTNTDKPSSTVDNSQQDTSKMDRSNSGDTTKNTTQDRDKPEKKNKQVKEIEAKKLGVIPENEANCPSDAQIKGKISKKHGNIYYLTQSNNYDKIKPDICFVGIENAEKAGFKASK